MTANTTVSLKDGAKIIRTVVLVNDRGEEETHNTFGVSLDGVVALLDRFPEFEAILTPKRGSETERVEFSLPMIIKMGPRIIGALIAAGLGKPGDPELEALAKKQPVGVQVKALREIVDLTFPGGLGPFVEDLKAMGLFTGAPRSSAGSSETSAAPASAESVDTGKVLATKS